MVRGRRVRAVVACAPPDACCSPTPKKRGPKIALLHPNQPSNTITAFFQVQTVEIADGAAKLRPRKPKPDTADYFDLFDAAGFDDVAAPTTPVMVRRPAKESTPHRIELCDDAPPCEPATPQVPAPKVRKRPAAPLSHKLTEYFPVRRSVRKTKTTVLEEKQRSMEELLRRGSEEGLEVKVFDDKGRGVVAAQNFSKGDFVVEYCGDLIDLGEAKAREEAYALDTATGCYMYYFKHNNQQYCVDATRESGKLGRLVNHSRNGNLVTRTVSVDGKPRLVLIAKDDIQAGHELTYDYGDRSKESLRHHPWLAY